MDWCLVEVKKLLILLFSLLLSPYSVFADDISDFTIEGMSVGESLLDYMTEEEILEEIELNKDDYSHLREPYKYVEIYIRKEFPTYDWISVIVRNNSLNKYLVKKNEKYSILFIRGHITYVENFNGCIQKRSEITEILSEIFPNAKKIEGSGFYAQDSSGNSIWDDISLILDSGDRVRGWCSNWEEDFRIKNSLTEGLSIATQSKTIYSWLTNY